MSMNYFNQSALKLVDYALANSPTQIAMNYMGNTASRGPMGPQQMPYQAPLSQDAGMAGGPRLAAVSAPIERAPGMFQRENRANPRKGLLEQLITNYK